MPQDKRRDFPKDLVLRVLEAQQFLCAVCGSFLLKGYHRDHADGDSSNISEENCRLLCGPCHRAGAGATALLQRQAEANLAMKNAWQSGIDEYTELIATGLAGSVSGTHLKEIGSAIDKKLKEAWRLNDPADYPEPLPPEIRLAIGYAEQAQEITTFLEGWKAAMNAIKVNIALVSEASAEG